MYRKSLNNLIISLSIAAYLILTIYPSNLLSITQKEQLNIFNTASKYTKDKDIINALKKISNKGLNKDGCDLYLKNKRGIDDTLLQMNKIQSRSRSYIMSGTKQIITDLQNLLKEKCK